MRGVRKIHTQATAFLEKSFAVFYEKTKKQHGLEEPAINRS
ncbi:hypothetical protein CCYN2B_240033 [Capnocytophaga cynodegmi]|uniref:Uncharacterized protein n=1 Tax=Capnocytophaga cynodegmi TaxID=28189 RepID=A0A0B7H6F1_9FLAO|nr:hypothetical protein CCYN2B_240033 [Capnocytophaga cynodegmi]